MAELLDLIVRWVHVIAGIMWVGNSMLYNSMIVYGCGNSDGNRHTHANLPVVLAGNGGGVLNPGRLLATKATPMCNLYLNMLDAMGVPQMERFGDSTVRLAEV